MSKGKKLSYEDVKEFIEITSESGCEIVTTKDEYINTSTNIEIKCKCGRPFTTKFTKFKDRNKRQCNECGREISGERRKGKKHIKSQEQIAKIKEKYFGIKEYIDSTGCELVTTIDEYENVNMKLEIKCKVCGKPFFTNFYTFRDKSNGMCNKCSRKVGGKKRRVGIEEVKKFIEVESDSGCKLRSTEYIGTNELLEIECACGEIFYKSFHKFKDDNQRICEKCGKEKLGEALRLPYDEVKRYIEIDSGSNCKLLSSTYKNYREKLELQCPEGHIFKMSYGDFKLNGCRCPICKESNGEIHIRNFLQNNNINFDSQYKFTDCRNIRPLPFDFVVFDKNNNIKLLIEYNGKQHYEPIDHFGGEEGFIYTKNNDNIKITYCKNNNINLLIIPYWDFSNLESILNEEILKITESE